MSKILAEQISTLHGVDSQVIFSAQKQLVEVGFVQKIFYAFNSLVLKWLYEFTNVEKFDGVVAGYQQRSGKGFYFYGRLIGDPRIRQFAVSEVKDPAFILLLGLVLEVDCQKIQIVGIMQAGTFFKKQGLLLRILQIEAGYRVFERVNNLSVGGVEYQLADGLVSQFYYLFRALPQIID